MHVPMGQEEPVAGIAGQHAPVLHIQAEGGAVLAPAGAGGGEHPVLQVDIQVIKLNHTPQIGHVFLAGDHVLMNTVQRHPRNGDPLGATEKRGRPRPVVDGLPRRPRFKVQIGQPETLEVCSQLNANWPGTDYDIPDMSATSCFASCLHCLSYVDARDNTG